MINSLKTLSSQQKTFELNNLVKEDSKGNNEDRTS